MLRLAEEWHHRTGGAFNPCLGGVMRRWDRAEAEQRLPDLLVAAIGGGSAIEFLTTIDRMLTLEAARGALSAVAVGEEEDETEEDEKKEKGEKPEKP